MNVIKEVLGPKMTAEEKTARINGPPPLERVTNENDEKPSEQVPTSVIPKTTHDNGKKVVCCKFI